MKIFASVLILFFSYNLSLACSCNKLTDADKDKAVIDSPVIFQGRVVSIESSRLFPADDRQVKFQVLRSWKGVDVNEIVIETPSDSGLCGYSFKEGSTYIVYARGNPHSTITCTMNAVDENRVREMLGEGKSFEESSQPEGFFRRLWQKIVSFFS